MTLDRERKQLQRKFDKCQQKFFAKATEYCHRKDVPKFVTQALYECAYELKCIYNLQMEYLDKVEQQIDYK